MRHHTEYTAEILGRIKAFTPIAGVAAAHHERLDGSGYPTRGTEPDSSKRCASASATTYSATT